LPNGVKVPVAAKPELEPEPKQPLNDYDPVEDFFDEHEREQLRNPHGQHSVELQPMRPWVIAVLVILICLISFAIGWFLS
jgi:hypothetical protein